MKTAVIVIGLLVVLVTAENEEKCPLMQALQRGIDECKESMKPSAETLELVKNGQGDDNKDVQCFGACMMEKAGLRNDGKLDVEKMESLMRSAEHPDEGKIQAVIAIANACKPGADALSDPCESMGSYSKCFKEKIEAATAAQ